MSENKYENILALVDDPTVKEGSNFVDEHLHKWLCMGMTRWVCRNGTLSDGHDKYTDAQKYAQAIKEMYSYASNIQSQKATAMEAQADLLDAEEELEKAEKQSDKLRAKAKVMQAQARLVGAETTVKDQLRCLDEFNKVRLELKEAVEKQYPHGIEQAEPDNWEAVFHAKAAKNDRLTNVPLSKEKKAQLGLQYMRLDAIIPELIANGETLTGEEIAQLTNLKDIFEKASGMIKGHMAQSKLAAPGGKVAQLKPPKDGA